MTEFVEVILFKGDDEKETECLGYIDEETGETHFF